MLGDWLETKQTNVKETTSLLAKLGRDMEAPPGRSPGAECGWRLEGDGANGRAIRYSHTARHPPENILSITSLNTHHGALGCRDKHYSNFANEASPKSYSTWQILTQAGLGPEPTPHF